MKYRPSRTKAREYAAKMDALQAFCDENGISYSSTMDSYYFRLKGQDYRVSNHSIESSNAAAYDWTGAKVRDTYHSAERKANIIYIHAGKTRIEEIYTDLKNGYELDGRGYRR